MLNNNIDHVKVSWLIGLLGHDVVDTVPTYCTQHCENQKVQNIFYVKLTTF